jgi:hypothetical protein
MPRGPKGEKRPADVIGAAVIVGRIVNFLSFSLSTSTSAPGPACVKTPPML